MMAVQDHGTIDNWNLGTVDGNDIGAQEMLNKLSPYLKIINNCGTEGAGCFPTQLYKSLKGDNADDFSSTSRGKAVLTDGTSIATYSSGGTLIPIYGQIYIDTNGTKPPNQWGKDLFLFYFYQNKLLPVGNNSNQGGLTFDNSCKDKSSSTGWSCAAWVLYNENMDYLHCSDLDWNVKLKCS